MIEKALIIIIFMYATSFALLGGQYLLSPFGVELTNLEGVPISSSILTIVQTDNLASVTNQLNLINGTQAEADPVTVAAGLVVDILGLLTGSYVFNLLFLIGVPPIFIYGMIVIYAIILFRALIAYLRGI